MLAVAGLDESRDGENRSGDASPECCFAGSVVEAVAFEPLRQRNHDKCTGENDEKAFDPEACAHTWFLVTKQTTVAHWLS